MSLYRLTDVDDPRVAAYRDVPEPELVRRRGLFVAEGRVVVRRLLESRRFRTRSMLVTETALAALRAPIEARLAADPAFEVFVAADDRLIAAGGIQFHRGCLALGERAASLSLDDLLHASRDVSSAGTSSVPLLLALESIANADNVGSLFRNAAAFGVGGVLLDDACCDPLYRKATRTSMGATLTIPFTTLSAAAWRAALRELQASGFVVLALAPPGSASIDTARLDVEQAAARWGNSPVVLLLGSEGAGLHGETLALADACVIIPIAPHVESLNVATAAGIALHRLARL